VPKITQTKCPECLEPCTKAELKRNRGFCDPCRDAHEEEDAMNAEWKRMELEYMCEEPEDYEEE
jgi:hypothetical protein